MRDMLSTIKDPSKVTDEQVTQAYQYLKEYCDEKGLDVMETINDDSNIKPASIEIHSKLPWVARKIIKAEKIEELILTNLSFIREKAAEQYKLEKKSPKKK